MRPAAIRTSGLTRRYGAVTAVDRLDLTVERGEIYALLGLNGAGKSTTIRLLLGMIRPTAGAVEVLGEPVAPDRPSLWRRVGHLVEGATAYPELTVRENLEVARRLQAVADPGATPRVLDRLALGRYADHPAGTLSTGNLQRLALARAVIHDPELLIVDEPTTALDPAGRVEIRQLLRALAHERGVTVFMSSHILGEVERVASRIGILHEGRLVEELDSAELERRRARRLVVGARDLDAAEAALRRAGYAPVRAAAPEPALELEDQRALDRPEDVARVLVAADAPPTRLTVEVQDLEGFFLALTNGSGS